MDQSFNPGDPGYAQGEGTNGLVRTVLVRADGKSLVGGDFLAYNGTLRYYMMRLNADGNPDNTFTVTRGPDGLVRTLALQPDGKVLVGGDFARYEGVLSGRIVRLNTDGTRDNTFSVGAGSNSSVYALALQPDGKVLVGGDFTDYKGTACNRIMRLNADGSRDNSFNIGTGANGTVQSLALQPDGKVLVGGDFTLYNGTARNRMMRLNADGSLDAGFDVGTGANLPVLALALQPNGRVLVGGSFTTYKGATHNRILRLNADGTPDNTFVTGTGADNTVQTLALQPDGKVLVGGDFVSYNSTTRNRIVRLDANGSLDNSFDVGTGANATVQALALQPDGDVILGGNFSAYKNKARIRLARVDANGSVDESFNVITGANGAVTAIAVQPDGKIILGGGFSTFNDVNRNRIVRVNADGSIDHSFDIGTGANGGVNALALQPDGKVLVGGNFTSFNGTARARILRLNSDGSLDNSFDVGTGANNGISSLALQPDGKVLIGGFFNTYNGSGRVRILRLNSDGSLDNSFTVGTGPNSGVAALALQPDGKVLVGGSFSNYNGVARSCIVRLNGDGSLDNSFAIGTGMSTAGGISIVYALALQPDGKVLAGGNFHSYNGSARTRIVRINGNGLIDATFNPGSVATTDVLALAVQADGKLVVGGTFSSDNGSSRNRLVRLNANGTIDNSFIVGTGASNGVQALSFQPDGKLMVGGSFTYYNGIGRNYIMRLQATDEPVSLGVLGTIAFCSGRTLQVPFTVPYSYTAGNSFNVQLSDPAGSFVIPVTIGTLSGTGSGNIDVTIPANSAAGSRYRIRIVSSSPATISADNGTDLAISQPPSASISYAGGTYQAGAGAAPVTLTGTSGGSFSSTNGLSLDSSSGTIDLSTSLPGTYTVTYGIAAAVCPAFATTTNITLLPFQATIGYPGSPYCADTGTIVAAHSGTTGGTYSATPAGLSINSVSGAIDLAASQAGTYTVSYSLGASNVTTQVAIRPNAFIQPQSNRVVCAGAPIPVTAFSGPIGINYSWTSSNSTIGLAAQGTGDVPSFTAQNLGDTALTAIISVQPSGGTGCLLRLTVYRITVNPLPSMQVPGAQTVCAGAATAPLLFSGSPGGTVNTWTNDNPSIGLGAVGTGDIHSFTARNESGSAQVGSITVTPRLNGCSGASRVFTLTVSPAAGAISYGQSSYCPIGRAYVRRSGSGGGSFSAAPAGLSIDAQTGTVNLAASVAGTYTITYNVTAGGGCSASAGTQLTVLPQATVDPVSNRVFCLGQMSTPIAFTGSAGTYTWTNDNPAIGLAASGTGNIPSFIPTATGEAVIRVTPQGSGSSACPGKAFVFRIRVRTCSLTQGGGTGDASTVRTAFITVSPNPARGQVTVRYEGPGSALTATLLTPAGAVALRPVPLRGNTVRLNLSGLPSGPYLLQLTDTRTGERLQRQVVKL